MGGLFYLGPIAPNLWAVRLNKEFKTSVGRGCGLGIARARKLSG